ncbi:MAG: glycosyltransferase [Trueperaceae bacterium]|nr:glycosyltransferase [Trueperaceae bacterium]
MTAAHNPRVSVVLPTYKRPDLLPRAAGSVQAQTLQQWQLIVVDDNDPTSPERQQTREVMEQLRSDPRITYIEHDRNRGGSAARNTGIRAATAPFVAFLDDDDSWYPGKLAAQVELLERSGDDVALVYCAFKHVAQDGSYRVMRPRAEAHTVEALLTRNGVGTTSAVVCRRSALLEVGGFDETLASRQDIDLYLRLALRYQLTFVDEVLLDFHRHAGAAIGKDMRRALEANQHFDAKHAELYRQYPDAAHHRLMTIGTIQRWAGKREDAWRTFLKAWRSRPFDLRAAAGMAALSPAADAARAVRDVVRRTLNGKPGSG